MVVDLPLRITPKRSIHFHGRSNELADLNLYLQPDGPEKSVITFCVLHGMAGIGKTELALEYSYRYSDWYSVFVWLDCHDKSMRTDSIKKFSNYFGEGVGVDTLGDALANLKTGMF